MTVNQLRQRKSPLARIAGPQAFNPYGLTLVAVVATIGTLSIYTSYDAQNFFKTFAILTIVQFFAFLPLVVLGPLVHSIKGLANRAAAVIGCYILANVIRSVVLDFLLIKWGIETESRLAFRIYSNAIFLSILMAVLAWGADLVADDISQVKVDEELIAQNKEKYISIIEEVEQARTYVTRELALEISATQAELEIFEFNNDLTDQDNKLLAELRGLLSQISTKLSELTRNPGLSRNALSVELPNRYSFSKIIDASTYVNPYLPGVLGGLSFVALAGWLGYFVDRLTAMRWASYLAVYSFIVYWLYRRYLVPRMRKRSSLVRLLIYELSLGPFVFFWLALLGYYAGDDSKTYGIAGANSISVFIFANITTFVSGVLAAASEYREALGDASKKLRDEIEGAQLIKTREENIWKEFFAGDLANSPTTATVRVRDVVSRPDGPSFSEVQPSVVRIWQNVLHQLSEV